MEAQVLKVKVSPALVVVRERRRREKEEVRQAVEQAKLLLDLVAEPWWVQERMLAAAVKAR